MDNPRHIAVVGCLVRDRAEKVLLVRHHKRGWEVPQGRGEEGETLLDALHREVLEESGIEVELEQLAAIWSKISPPAAIVFNFLARYKSGRLRTSEECPEVGWFPPDSALALITHPVNYDRLKTLLHFSGVVVYQAYSSNPYRIHVEDLLTGGR